MQRWHWAAGAVAVLAVGTGLFLAVPRNDRSGSTSPAPPQAGQPAAPSDAQAQAPQPTVSGEAAAQEDPAAAQTIARLQRDEAAVKRVRLSALVVQRIAPLPAAPAATSITPGEALKKARQAPIAARQRERLTMDGKRWKRETAHLGETGAAQSGFVAAYDGEVGRVLQSSGPADESPPAGFVGPLPDLDTSIQLLLARGAAALKDVTWTGQTQSGGKVTLTGRRGAEQITATLRTDPLRVVRLVRESQGETQQGPVDQREDVTVTYASTGDGLAPRSVETLVVIRGAKNGAALSRYAVEDVDLNPTFRPAEVALGFPVGTTVTDQRLQPPVEYVQGTTNPTVADLQRLQEKQIAAVGRAAPDWGLKTLAGDTVKPQDYRGKVVLLTWFASW